VESEQEVVVPRELGQREPSTAGGVKTDIINEIGKSTGGVGTVNGRQNLKGRGRRLMKPRGGGKRVVRESVGVIRFE